MPTTWLGRFSYSTLRAVRNGFRLASRAQFGREGANAGELYAFYDLEIVPITFDFLWFLVGAEIERRQQELPSIHVVIVPGRQDGLRREAPDYEQVIHPVARRARIFNILVSACHFLPSVSGVTIAGSRNQAESIALAAGTRIFPAQYEPAMPRRAGADGPLRLARQGAEPIGVLRAAEFDLLAIDRWLASHALDKRLVAITLREYSYMPARNSNLAAWATFARKLDPSKYSVVFLRDTEECFGPLPRELKGLTIFREPSVNLGLRMALYERAYLNMGVNNGPMGLCWLNDRACYITFKILTAGVPQTTPEYLRFLGFEIGRSLPFAKPWQKWVWEDDELDVIEREFAAMTERLSDLSAI